MTQKSLWPAFSRPPESEMSTKTRLVAKSAKSSVFVEKRPPKHDFRGGVPPPGGVPPDKLARQVDLVLEIPTRIRVLWSKPHVWPQNRENVNFSPLISIGKTIFSKKVTLGSLFIDFDPQTGYRPVLCLKHPPIACFWGSKRTPDRSF